MKLPLLIGVVLLLAGCATQTGVPSAESNGAERTPANATVSPQIERFGTCSEVQADFTLPGLSEPPGDFRLVRDALGNAIGVVVGQFCKDGPGNLVVAAILVHAPERASLKDGENAIVAFLWTDSDALVEAFRAWNVSIVEKHLLNFQTAVSGAAVHARFSSERYVVTVEAAQATNGTSHASIRYFAFTPDDFVLQGAFDILRQPIAASGGAATGTFMPASSSNGGILLPAQELGSGRILGQGDLSREIVNVPIVGLNLKA